MIGASGAPSLYDSSERVFDTSHTTLNFYNGEVSPKSPSADALHTAPTTICGGPDPDKGKPGSHVGTNRFFPLEGNPRGTITWVKADMALTRLQGTSSSSKDPKDGSVWIMELGGTGNNYIQVGIMNRGNKDNSIFSAWGHKVGEVDGMYCERRFGKATGSYSFEIYHDESKGIFYLKENNVVIQKISETNLGWSKVTVAEIMSETHGPPGYAKLPVSKVTNIHISNEGALYGSWGGGPVAAEAMEHTVYSYTSDPNKPTGFTIKPY